MSVEEEIDLEALGAEQANTYNQPSIGADPNSKRTRKGAIIGVSIVIGLITSG